MSFLAIYGRKFVTKVIKTIVPKGSVFFFFYRIGHNVFTCNFTLSVAALTVSEVLRYFQLLHLWSFLRSLQRLTFPSSARKNRPPRSVERRGPILFAIVGLNPSNSY